MNVVSPPASEEQQACFFGRVQEGFQKAAADSGQVTHHLRLARTSIRLRFAGPALLPTILPALSHASVPDPQEPPGLDLCIWDSASTGVPLAPPPRPHADFTGRGNIWGFDSLRYKSAYQWGEGSVSVMDRGSDIAFYWVPAADNLPPWSIGSPLRGILHWWMEKNGLQLVHAAVAGDRDRGALIPGRGGSGKSSTAVACLTEGMQFVGDDYVVLGLDPEPRAHCLYATVKLHPHSLEAFPQLARSCRAVTAPGFDKVILFPEGRYREQFAESLPLSCVLRPVINGGSETTLGPASAIETERALAAETLAHLPHAGSHTLALLERVSRELPGATLLLGADRPGVAHAIRKAIASPPAPLESQPLDTRPIVTVLIHLHDSDPQPLRALTADLEAQQYPRLEVVLLADSAAVSLAEEAARIPFNVYFLPFENNASKADAWNRGVRDSFGELLFFVESGDRIPSGALDSLGTAVAASPEASLIRGVVEGSEAVRPLAGSLIRKAAFRTCGFFDTEIMLIGREEKDWMDRFSREQLIERALDRVTLHAASSHAVRLSVFRERVGWLRASRRAN